MTAPHLSKGSAIEEQPDGRSGVNLTGVVAELGHEVPRSRFILGMRVDATSYEDATRQVITWAGSSLSRYVCVAAVSSVMEAHDDARFMDVMNQADLVTPDGMPLVWGLRRLGVRRATRVYGPDLTASILDAAEREGLAVGFYGGAPNVLEALEAFARRRWPQLKIAFAYSPPYRDLTAEEDRLIVQAIDDRDVKILFVGLGCPKQETWMASHRGQVRSVMVGVGAAFDFLAGTKKQAPRSLQKVGLEWLFRLATEPKRLWKRYLLQNPRFALLFGAQLVRTIGRPQAERQDSRSESPSTRISGRRIVQSPHRAERAWLVVLAFHRVVDRPTRDHDISWDDFHSLLDGLDASRVTVSLGADPLTFTGDHVVLTFDDATEDHHDVSLELDRRQMKGIFFVPPARLDKPSFLNSSQLRSMAARGHVVGAHGLDHVPLAGMPTDALVREVRDSKEALEDLLGQAVDLFAPPGGVYSGDLPAQLAQHGYVAARSMVWGTYRSVNERWRIPCVPVTSFILRRGWLATTLETGRIPAAMKWFWRTKQVLPPRLRFLVRGAVHGRLRTLSKTAHRRPDQ
jgi:N-acetylglucosaminyldiphosphoundecaprenol N-acetyl-beta-D-mannosaminyltransferase